MRPGIDRPEGDFCGLEPGRCGYPRVAWTVGPFVVVVNEGDGVNDKQRLILLRVQPLYRGGQALSRSAIYKAPAPSSGRGVTSPTLEGHESGVLNDAS